VGVAALVVALLAARSGRTGGRSTFARLPAAEALLVILALAYAGRTALRIPDWQSEQALATAMIRDDPGHSYARYVLGYAFATGGRVTEAEPLLLESAELNPMQWRTWNALCFVHLRMNRLDEAAEECEHSLRLHTRNSRTWLNLASVRLLQQRWPDAVAAAARALALRPCYASALHVQAVAFEKVGELEKAVATLKLGRGCDPSHVGLGELEEQLIDRGVLRQSPDGPR
jgi:tetratricopeptide (TPR) repeat protein